MVKEYGQLGVTTGKYSLLKQAEDSEGTCVTSIKISPFY